MRPEIEKAPMSGLEHFWVLWRRKWIIIAVAAGVYASFMWYTRRQEPVYEAATTIQINVSEGSSLLDHVRRFTEAPRAVDSEIEILKSRVIAERAAVTLGAHYSVSDLPPGASVQLNGVGVTNETTPGAYTVTFFAGDGDYQVTDPAQKPIGVGKVGQPFGAGGLTFTLATIAGNAGRSFQIHVRPLADVGDALRSRLSVAPFKGTSILLLKVRAADPSDAMRAANTYAETYVSFTREQGIQQVVSVRQFLEKQIDEYRQDLLRTGEIFAKSSGEQQDSVLSHIASSNVKNELAKRFVELEMQRIAMASMYTPSHRSLIQVEREIADIRNRLTSQLRPERKNMPILDLLKESEAKRGSYNFMYQKLQETRIAEASETGFARVIDRAIPPKTFVSPNVSRSAKLGGIFGLLLGIGVALFLDFVDRSVKNVKDAEDRVGLPVLGAIPEIARRKRNGYSRSNRRERKTADPDKLLVGGRSPEVEAYRLLRANVQFAISDAPSGVFLFTSAGPGEGKSLTLANLAIALSQMKKRVLLVDVDLRRPVQHRLFRVPGEPGITNVLQEGLPWQEAVKPTDVEGLHVIPSGRLPPDPTELVGGEGMREFLREAQQEYDLVLLDSPPVLLYADSCHLAAETSGVFVVARRGVSTPEDIRRTRSMIETTNAKLTGLILNRISSADGFGTYRYRYYYDSDEDNGDPSGKRLKRVAGRLLRHVRRL
ncbi:MAG: polysaccharide biosynthesis tyrosine autokinase [Deltaproteobacteria bacterium]|nr:polysaccharide biosynthesis tyrosine autokinase [Deltaproteobacteria bacterium]